MRHFSLEIDIWSSLVPAKEISIPHTRRHQLLIETIIYSSLGSLRRVKGSSSGEEGNVTTTTKVDFFPRYISLTTIHTTTITTITTTTTTTYTTTNTTTSSKRYSIVNKSRRAQKGGERGSPAKKEGAEKKEKIEKEEKEEKRKEEEPPRERKTPLKPHVPATYSIFTTLKFPPKGKRPALHKPPSGKQDTSFLYKEETSKATSKKSAGDTSFYYKDNSSSNYDLTLARKEKEVVAMVHEASPKVIFL